jgi:hypothetical protein
VTEKDLRKLNRVQILELFLEQCRRNEELEKELEAAKKELASKEIKIAESGSIAEASLALTGIFEEAQKAAEIYLSNIKRIGFPGYQEQNAGSEIPSEEEKAQSPEADATEAAEAEPEGETLTEEAEDVMETQTEESEAAEIKEGTSQESEILVTEEEIQAEDVSGGEGETSDVTQEEADDSEKITEKGE